MSVKVKNNIMSIYKKPTKFSPKGYYKPTPAKFRKVGDALLVGSAIVSTQFGDNPKVMLITQIAGIVGKFLTNFFH
jgi:hypothetical protein